MKTFKIFLAVLMIMLVSNLLSGCSPQSSRDDQAFVALSMANLQEAKSTRKSVELSLEKIKDNKKHLELNLVLSNPENKPLSSAEIWLSYQPKHLKGMSFTPNPNLFELMAPYENGFDQEKGLFKFGRSTVQPTTDEQLVLGQMVFEKLSQETTFVDTYDYAYDLQGHASVNMMVAGEPINILIEPHTPLFVRQ